MQNSGKYLWLLGLVVLLAVCVGPILAQEVEVVTEPVAGEEEVAAVEPIDPDSLADDTVLLTLNGEDFYVWQARAMVANHAAPTLNGAANLWVEIQLKTAEARARGLADDEATQFILALYQDYFLSGSILNEALGAEIADPTDAEVEAYYTANIARYERAMNAMIQHITIRDGGRPLAERVVEMANAADADFNTLVAAYSQSDDKARQGQMRGGMQMFQQQLGETAATAIAESSAGAVLGPFVGPRGFEVVKVSAVTPATVLSLEDVRANIEQELRMTAQRAAYEAMMERLNAAATIEKSAELEALEAMPPQNPMMMPR